MTKSMRIGLYGGTFDPIHQGHLIAAEAFLRDLELDVVWFMPAGSPPHKPGEPISPFPDRLRMIELAIAHHPHLRASRLDGSAAAPSFTVELLRRLRQENSANEYVFLMGADSLLDLPNWKDPAAIVQMAEIGVAARPGVAVRISDVAASIRADPNRIHIVEMPAIDISSTDIRRRISKGESIAFLTPAAVERYVIDNQLYRNEKTAPID